MSSMHARVGARRTVPARSPAPQSRASTNGGHREAGLLSRVHYVHPAAGGGRYVHGTDGTAARHTPQRRATTAADSALASLRVARLRAQRGHSPATVNRPRLEESVPGSPGSNRSTTQARLTQLQQSVLKAVRDVGLEHDQFMAVSRAVRLCVWQAAEDAKADEGGTLQLPSLLYALCCLCSVLVAACALTHTRVPWPQSSFAQPPMPQPAASLMMLPQLQRRYTNNATPQPAVVWLQSSRRSASNRSWTRCKHSFASRRKQRRSTSRR